MLIRAGGHVLCESGWELADSPAGQAALAQEQPVDPGPVEPDPDAAAPETLHVAEPDEVVAAEPTTEAGPAEPTPEGEPAAPAEPDADTTVASEGPAPDPDRCPDCGKQPGTKRDGTLRRHTCVIDAAAPQVTFESRGK